MSTTLVNNDNFASIYQKLHNQPRLTVDDETNGLKPFAGDRLCGIAVLAEGEQAYYFPFRHAGGQNLDHDKFVAMNVLLSNPDVLYEGHNYGFDLKFQAKDGIEYPRLIWDTQSVAHLLDENEPSFKLKSLGVKHIDEVANVEEKKLNNQLSMWGYGKGEMWRLSPHMVAPYAGQDVILTRALADHQRRRLKKLDMYSLGLEINEFTLIIDEIMQRGMGINPELCEANIKEAEREALKIRQEICEIAGHDINLASPKQVCSWLGIPSSAKDKLEELDAKHEVKLLLDYRAWAKSISTYYSVFLRDRDENDRVHCNIKVHGTISGRLSVSDPAFQAIPVMTDIYRIKDVIGEDADEWEFVEADYSQAEMRVASHYGRERNMARLLMQGADLHGVTATNIGIPRNSAKRINFGVIYGIGGKALSEQLKISENKARGYLDKYHRQYPGFRWLYKKAETMAKRREYITMFTGRRRNFNVETAYTHKASSNLIQGTVAEMVRVAMCRVNRELPKSDIQMLMQVHDSIIFRVKKNNRLLVREVVRIMEDTPWCDIPHKVDVKIGPTWGLAKDM